MWWRTVLQVLGGLLLTAVLIVLPAPLTMPAEYPANVVHYIVIHHAASGAADFPAAAMEGAGRSARPRVGRGKIVTPRGVSLDISASEIDALHRAEGFDAIGYNYVVRFDGTVEK